MRLFVPTHNYELSHPLWEPQMRTVWLQVTTTAIVALADMVALIVALKMVLGR